MFSSGILRPAIRHCTRNSGPIARRSISLTLPASRLRPHPRFFASTARTMSDSKPQTYTFLVYAPDYTDPDAYNRRLAVRQEHLSNAKGLLESGFMRLGGAMVSPETYQTADRKLIGSMMVFEAENLETVRKAIEADIYYTSRVWDKENLVILPWVSAAPLPPVKFE